ncbi:MAG TPA: hypothetical protein VFF00_04670, partial [Candidatus Elarobacter sp.]|nr:hypothetical protein [Candidatus Elarobacter sp.]
MFRAALVVLAAAFVLAGCGGRTSLRSALPGPPGTPGRSVPGLQSSNVNLFNGTLWYGDGPVLLGVSLQSGGSDARIEGTLDGIVDAVPRAMTIAPDGTLYDLIDSGGTSWRMQMFAPGARSAAQPEQYIDGVGSPRQIVLVADGIDVLSMTSPGTRSQSAVLWTYAYAAGNAPSPIRRLALGANVTDVAADGNGRIYAAHSDGSGIAVYAPAATGAGARVRTIATRAHSDDAIAVGPDGTVYVLSKDDAAGTATIDAYAPAAAGPQPSRTIGPFTRSRGSVTGGITVDSEGNLYVGFDDARRVSSADVFAPNASGTPSPLRTIPIPTHNGFVTSIVIGPLVPPPSGTRGTLYVGTADRVLAFDSAATGFSAPQRTITGLGGPDTFGALALATRSNGELWVMQGTFEVGGSVGGCRITVESPSADGTNGVLQTLDCGGTQGVGLVHGAADGMDLLVKNSADPAYRVRRLGSAAGDFQLPAAFTRYSGFTTDAAGNMYVGAGDHVDVFDKSAPSGAAPIRSISFAGYRVGQLAVAPDGRLYALTFDSGPFGTHFIQVVAPGGSSPYQTIGPILDVQAVVGIATDSGGSLYVGEQG